jgi:hypothetical protein
MCSLKGNCRRLQTVVDVKRQGWGESCSIRLWERKAYVLEGARTFPFLKGKCVRANMQWNLGRTVPARAGDPTADS